MFRGFYSLRIITWIKALQLTIIVFRAIGTMNHHHIIIRNTFHWFGYGPNKVCYNK